MLDLNSILIGIAWLLVCVAALPLLVLVSECLLALLPKRAPASGQRKRVAVLVPAHNEATVIAHTVANLHPQLRPGDRLLVVADNCTDATAELARRAGAEVVERSDATRRGKGFALDAGVRFLEQDPTDVVIIFDADCEAEDGLIDHLAQAVDGTGRPVQGLYLMQLPPRFSPEAMVSVFAFLVKNWVRARALQRISVPVLLTGSAMAFPWEVIQRSQLANDEIVEDLALGLQLAEQGRGPCFCEQAVAWSQLPLAATAAISQRTRWEHGYLSAILRYVPRLLKRAAGGRIGLLPVALDLAVPPLSLLVLLSALTCGIVFCLALWTGAWLPLAFLLGAGCLAAAMLLVSWWRFARHLIPPHMLKVVPSYVIGKIGIYRRFIGHRQTQWIRTQRDGELGQVGPRVDR